MRELIYFFAFVTSVACVVPSSSIAAPSSYALRCQALLEDADSLMRVGMLDHARAKAEEAFESAVTHIGPQDSSAARALSLLGSLAWQAQQFTEAGDYWSRSVSISEAVFGKGNPELAQAYSNLGSAQYTLGRFEDAAAHYERALQSYTIAFGPNHHTVAVVEANLASLYVDLGRFTAAEPLFRDAIRIQRTELGDQHPTVAASLRDLGTTCFEQGRLEDAEDHFLTALEVQQKAYLPAYPNSPEIGKTLASLAALYARRGRYAEAEHSYRRAVHIIETSLGPNHPDRVEILIDLAMVYFEQGRAEQADSLLSLAQSALTYRNNPLREAAACDEKRAILKAAQGDSESADSLFRLALDQLGSLLPPDHPQLLQCSSEYAMFCSLRGRHLMARELMSRSFFAFRDIFISDGVILPERVALQYAHRLERAANEYLTVLLNCTDSVSTWGTEIAATVVGYKGLATGIIAERNRSATVLDEPEIIALRDSLSRARHELARLRLNSPAVITADYGQKLGIAAAFKERCEAKLAGMSEEFRHHQELENLSTDQIAAILPSKSAAIDYIKYNHRLGPVSVEPRYLAVVWRPGVRPRVVELGRADSIESAISWYNAHFERFESEAPNDYDAISAEVYRKIWAPVADLLGDAELVFISPDGELHLVSFAGLKAPDGRYLIESSAVHYVANLRELYRLTSNAGKTTSTSTESIISFGNPDFDWVAEPHNDFRGVTSDSVVSGGTAQVRTHTRSGCQTLRDLQWKPLPHSAEEVKLIAAAWQSTHGTATLCTGVNATETKFKAEAGSFQVVHVATHGYFAGSECSGKEHESMIERRFVGENPLLASGLVLAGANRLSMHDPWQNSDDGLLSAEEISSLDLSAVDLVLLSACGTGRGGIKNGEGVFGLSRAFRLAGARAVVSTLWPVGDSDAADFVPMLLAGGLPLTPQRVRTAAINRIKSLADKGKSTHPYYWAGFVVSGDWN